jgi:hypothetical protein
MQQTASTRGPQPASRVGSNSTPPTPPARRAYDIAGPLGASDGFQCSPGFPTRGRRHANPAAAGAPFITGHSPFKRRFPRPRYQANPRPPRPAPIPPVLFDLSQRKMSPQEFLLETRHDATRQPRKAPPTRHAAPASDNRGPRPAHPPTTGARRGPGSLLCPSVPSLWICVPQRIPEMCNLPGHSPKPRPTERLGRPHPAGRAGSPLHPFL